METPIGDAKLQSAKSINNNVSTYNVMAAEEIGMFSIDKFEDRLKQHLTETFHVDVSIEKINMTDGAKREKPRVCIRITGTIGDIDHARDYLIDLFSSICTREYTDENDGQWTRIDEAIDMIRHHCKLENVSCICVRKSPRSICIHYFDTQNPQFGIDDSRIEEIINNKFTAASVSCNSQSASSRFAKELANLQETIRTRNDYGKNICYSQQENNIYLFGLAKLVKDLRNKFEEIKNKHLPQPCEIKLQDKQLKFLQEVAIDELKKLEKKYKADDCDLSLELLQQYGSFLAPPDLHSKIKESIQEIVHIARENFEIKNNAFITSITKDATPLTAIIKSKCVMETKVRTVPVDIFVAKSQAMSSNQNQTVNPTGSQATDSESYNVGNSTIKIQKGDLRTQTVDIVVVCSTSQYLCESILNAAGQSVMDEYNSSNMTKNQATAISNGSLPCKKLLMIPCQLQSANTSALHQKLSSFVADAITYAFNNNYKTIAIPSVGCGKVNIDPTVVANCMINETRTQLMNNASSIEVSFILESARTDVFDAFVKQASALQKNPSYQLTPGLKSPNTNRRRAPLLYHEKTIEITLYSSNKTYLNKCKNEIIELAKSFLHETQLSGKEDLTDWSQSIINQYYKYCLERDVVPTIDLDTFTITLKGGKDQVHAAETYFYSLTNEALKQARLDAEARNVIWSYETTPNSDTWEQYSYKLIGTIEVAYVKKLPHVDFENDKQEKSRIVFYTMKEIKNDSSRNVRRKLIDSLLPNNWEPSDQNCKRVVLQPTSKEYQDVLQKFNATMNGQYRQIIKIERIQNERWYKQYAAHRDEYKRRHAVLDERLLFHGCTPNSSNEIIQQCFNRSFAGVNGVLYGCGVYFHEKASYSHSYAKPGIAGERTMFLARILVGKSCNGNPTMKVPPPGYDTTTDGQHIFVVYHDAGAYADHLITYQ